jgi:anti-sigma B factor antagonist
MTVSAAPFQLTVEESSPQAAVVHLHGRLDLLSAGEVRQRLTDTVAQGWRRLVVDLSEVSFIDSTGLGCLIGGLKVARQAGGDLRIAGANEQARMILRLTALERILHPYASVEEARADY